MVSGQAQTKECPTCHVVTDGQWFCRNCGDFFRAPGTGRVLAGLWRRFAAALLDIVFFYLLLIVGWFIWFAFTAREGQTPGKKLLGLRVIRLDGTVPSAGTMWLREVVVKGILGYWVTGGLGTVASFVWAFFDRDRQTIHDKMASTYVIHYPGSAEALTPVPLAPGEQFAPQAGLAAVDQGVEAQLRRLARMKDDGLITNDEYQEKRHKLVEKL